MRNILILFLTLLLVSCTQNHYEKDVWFEHNNWIKFNDLEYQIPVEKGKQYDFWGYIITDSTFNQRKIDLGFYLYLPSGEERLADLNFRILDFEYNPLGEKIDVGFKNELIFKENLSINESGTLKLLIVLHSQYYNNEGIKGLQLVVREK